MAKKIAVSGSDGFIASHTIEVLHDKGYEVVGIQRHIGTLQVGTVPESAKPDVLYFGDVRDKSLVEKACSSCDGIIHLAGILGTQETIHNPYPSVETNIVGALNFMEAAKLYGVPMVQIAVGNHWMNNSYSITKTTAERFAVMYHNEHKMSINVVRALNAFGERQKWYPVRKMMPNFIIRALTNIDIAVYGDGMQVMDFVYVKDVGEILLAALFDGNYGNIYEAGTGIGLPVKEWAEKIIEYVGSSSKLKYLPMRPGEPPNSAVVSSNPYPYQYTKVEESLKNTVEWYRTALADKTINIGTFLAH